MAAAASATLRPVAALPVKATLARPGCLLRCRAAMEGDGSGGEGMVADRKARGARTRTGQGRATQPHLAAAVAVT